MSYEPKIILLQLKELVQDLKENFFLNIKPMCITLEKSFCVWLPPWTKSSPGTFRTTSPILPQQKILITTSMLKLPSKLSVSRSLRITWPHPLTPTLRLSCVVLQPSPLVKHFQIPLKRTQLFSKQYLLRKNWKHLPKFHILNQYPLPVLNPQFLHLAYHQRSLPQI